MNNLVEMIIKELTEVEPFEITIDPRPNLKTDPIEKQGEDIWHEFVKAKRKRDRKRMLLYIYYIGEIFETNLSPNRDRKSHKYLTDHYFKTAIKTYQLFSLVTKEQIFRTKKLTLTIIRAIHISDMENIEEKLKSYQNEVDIFSQEFEIQEGESVTPQYLSTSNNEHYII
jgi:hypothetical protein